MVAVIIIVVVVALILVGLSFAGVGPLGGVVGDSGTIATTVSHTGVSTITTDLLINGASVATFDVPPQDSYTYDYHATWTGSGCFAATVTADGSGGLLGPTSESQSVTLCNGGTQTVDLTV